MADIARMLSYHAEQSEPCQRARDRDGGDAGTTRMRARLRDEGRTQNCHHRDDVRGALLVGDFNYIADPSWRSTASSLSANDNILRDLLASADSEYVYNQEGSADLVVWTRRAGTFNSNTGAREGEGAMLDGAIAFGDNQRKWKRTAIDFIQKGNQEPLSDHAWLTFSREIPQTIMQGSVRPRSPFPRGDPALKDKYRELVRNSDLALKIQESARKKEQALESTEATPDVFATPEAVRLLRETAVQASEEISSRRKETPKEASHRWRGWLREAYQLRSSGVDPREVRGGLFMACSGLSTIRRRYENSEAKYIWDKIIKRCHRQLNRAKANLIRKQQREDERVKELSLGIVSGKRGSDAMRLAMEAWRAIKKPA